MDYLSNAGYGGSRLYDGFLSSFSNNSHRKWWLWGALIAVAVAIIIVIVIYSVKSSSSSQEQDQEQSQDQQQDQQQVQEQDSTEPVVEQPSTPVTAQDYSDDQSVSATAMAQAPGIIDKSDQVANDFPIEYRRMMSALASQKSNGIDEYRDLFEGFNSGTDSVYASV